MHHTAKRKNEQPHALPKQTRSQTSETETWEMDEFVKHGVYLAGLDFTQRVVANRTRFAVRNVTGNVATASVEAVRKLRSSGPYEGD